MIVDDDAGASVSISLSIGARCEHDSIGNTLCRS